MYLRDRPPQQQQTTGRVCLLAGWEVREREQDGGLAGPGAAAAKEEERGASGEGRGGEGTQVRAHLLQDLHLLRPLRPLPLVREGRELAGPALPASRELH